MFTYAWGEGVRGLLTLADKGDGGVNNCSKSAYVIRQGKLICKRHCSNYKRSTSKLLGL